MGEGGKGEIMEGKEVESVSVEKHLEELKNKNRIILKEDSRGGLLPAPQMRR